MYPDEHIGMHDHRYSVCFWYVCRCLLVWEADFRVFTKGHQGVDLRQKGFVLDRVLVIKAKTSHLSPLDSCQARQSLWARTLDCELLIPPGVNLSYLFQQWYKTYTNSFTRTWTMTQNLYSLHHQGQHISLHSSRENVAFQMIHMDFIDVFQPLLVERIWKSWKVYFT